MGSSSAVFQAVLSFAWPFSLSQVLYWYLVYIPASQPSLR